MSNSIIALLLFIGCACANLSGEFNGGIYYRESDTVSIVSDSSTNLDFSVELPYLTTLNIVVGSSNGQDDQGLGKNVYLKNLIAGSQASSQVPVSFSYLPSVENYSVIDAYHNLDYLSRALPYLKNFSIQINNTRDLADILQNISHLELLENLTINSDYYSWSWGVFNIFETTFNWEELRINGFEFLSKMAALKNLTITVRQDRLYDYQYGNEVDRIKSLLPNTNVNVEFVYYQHPYDY